MTSTRNQRLVKREHALFTLALTLLVAGCGKEEAVEQTVARPVKAIKAK